MHHTFAYWLSSRNLSRGGEESTVILILLLFLDQILGGGGGEGLLQEAPPSVGKPAYICYSAVSFKFYFIRVCSYRREMNCKEK